MTLTCADVDSQQWRADNRAPVYRDRVNRWLFARTTSDGLAGAELQDAMRQAFARMHQSLLDGPAVLAASVGGRIGPFDRVVIGSPELAEPTMPPVPTSAPVRTAWELDPMPLLAASEDSPNVAWCPVEFVWRGAAADLPWPTWRPGVLDQHCPIGCAYMLYRVEAPGEEVAPTTGGRGATLPKVSAPSRLRWAAFGAVAGIGLLLWAASRMPRGVA